MNYLSEYQIQLRLDIMAVQGSVGLTPSHAGRKKFKLAVIQSKAKGWNRAWPQLWTPAVLVLLGVTGKVQFGAIPSQASTSYVDGGHTTHSHLRPIRKPTPYRARPYIRSTVLVVKMTHYTRSSNGFSLSEPDSLWHL
jgi:hypothetical protein